MDRIKKIMLKINVLWLLAILGGWYFITNHFVAGLGMLAFLLTNIIVFSIVPNRGEIGKISYEYRNDTKKKELLLKEVEAKDFKTAWQMLMIMFAIWIVMSIMFVYKYSA